MPSWRPGHGPAGPLRPGDCCSAGSRAAGNLAESLVGARAAGPGACSASAATRRPVRRGRRARRWPPTVAPASAGPRLARARRCHDAGLIVDMLPARGTRRSTIWTSANGWTAGASLGRPGQPAHPRHVRSGVRLEGGDRGRPALLGRDRSPPGRADVPDLPGRHLLENAGRHGRCHLRPALRSAPAQGRTLRLLPPVERLVFSRDRNPCSDRRRPASHRATTRSCDVPAGVRRGLPVFPDHADGRQLAAGTRLGEDLESTRPARLQGERLEAGQDYDAVVLAVPPGMIEKVGAELIAADARWQQMVETVASVATHSAQLWVMEDERVLGWPHRAAIVSGFGQPFDTFASMSHTLPFETWPAGRLTWYRRPPLAVCSRRDERRRAALPRRAVSRLWPAYQPAQLMSWYYRANTDPSDRYVVALPGSGRYRLPADGSGFTTCSWPVTGSTRGSTPGASRRPPCRGCKPPTPSRAQPSPMGPSGSCRIDQPRAETRT